MKFKKCAALLLVSSCLLTGCTSSSAKKVDSKYVVASLEKGNKTKNIFADNLYKDIIDNSSNNSTVFNAVLQNLVDQKFPVNDDMKEDAATIIKQIKSAYKSNYGDNYKDSLNQALTSAGYKNLSEYRQRMIKQIQYANFLLDYIDDHFDDVFNDYYQQCAPKYVSLIKISVSDTSSPTDDETSKLNEVKELISNTDKSFGDIAQDKAFIYSIPIPIEFHEKRLKRKLTVTLAYLSPIHPSSIKYREKQVWMTINNGNSLIGSRVEYDYHAVQRGTLQHEIFENNSIEVWDIDESIELKINCRGCASENNPEMLIPYALFATFEMAPDCGVEVYQKVVTKVQTKNAIKTM